jgi:hypothetical protein
MIFLLKEKTLVFLFRVILYFCLYVGYGCKISSGNIITFFTSANCLAVFSIMALSMDMRAEPQDVNHGTCVNVSSNVPSLLRFG